MYALLLTERDLRSQAETDALFGKYANVADFEYLIEEDSIVVAPNAPQGIAARLVTGCLNTKPDTVELFRTVEGDLSNRGFGVPLQYRERSDKSFGHTKDVPRSLIVPGESNFLGWYDKTPREPFCRPTAWSLERPDILEISHGFVKHVLAIYREELPHLWRAQMEFMKCVSPQFKYPEGGYTTVTVNHDVRTPYHYDEGDFAGGLGNLVVLDGTDDTSGVIVMPRERIAFLVRPGDVLFMNVHTLHGNLPLTEGKERLTAVLYARQFMHQCE
jgi:hypothetical protein